MGSSSNYSAKVDAQGCRLLCRHCQKKKVNRPRGLCWACYYRHGVRDLYPSTSKYARRGITANSSGGKDEPTDEPPGSEEKIRVMERRAKLGLDLFQDGEPECHPGTFGKGRISESVYKFPDFPGSHKGNTKPWPETIY